MIKAVIFDLDGTAIPNKKAGMPSQRLIKTVAKAQSKAKVSIATGRALSNVRHILKALKITSPSIIAGGTQIINPQTEETLWKKELSAEQTKAIIDICMPYSYEIWISDNAKALSKREDIIIQPEQVIYLMAVSKEDTKIIMQKLEKISDIVAHEIKSWTPDHIDIHITHIEATKKHALIELLKLEQIAKKDVMAVGDGNNDLPLFEIAGFKVAMGNAMDKLKKNADYITDSVDDDGLAKVIEEKLSL
ncbi:MAG TPA: HAD family hydrolase [Candidatus Sulfotelmatobacter sp.]|jgi:Cof subfamily protein (haloacid dehalogenase superfamily)|nr:HAD family hydrolase [Candidatus Sulfotelmatobacter sp.]